jgi:hypothetical protein
VLLSEKRVQHFTPPRHPWWGFSCLLTRGPSSKLKRRAGRSHAPTKFVLRKRRNEVLATPGTRMTTTPAKPASVTAICAAVLRASPGSLVLSSLIRREL